MRLVISSGHGKYVRGASGLIDEVDEARRVVASVIDKLRRTGHMVIEFHDDTSTTQQQNLQTIVNFHNAQQRDYDVSVHFNAYVATQGARGTEVLYVTQQAAATKIAAAIADGGNLLNRGAHKRTDLYFLNKTNKPAVLIEVCFVDAAEDVKNYQANFDSICSAIASVPAEPVVVGGDTSNPPSEIPLSTDRPPVQFTGKCSWFGGPNDTGVAPDEGLAFIYSYDQRPDLFLPQQPPGTTGLARRLDPEGFYVACRWDYGVTPKTMLADKKREAVVSAGNRFFLASPADWGPHGQTGRVADLSPGLMEALGIKTDDTVTVEYPAT